MSGDCHAVTGYGNARISWKFYWTPPAGTALTDATFFWGTVDGDCGMNSLRDDVKEKKLTVRRVGASRPTIQPARSRGAKREWAGLIGALLGAGVGLTLVRGRSLKGRGDE